MKSLINIKKVSGVVSGKMLIILFCLFFSFKCNDKNKVYTTVNGAWNVTQESQLTGFRKYNVSINENPYEKGSYIIYNLYQSGDANETRFTITDNTLTLEFNTNPSYEFIGQGTIEQDFKTIFLNFTAYYNGFEDMVSAKLTRN